MHHPRSTSPWTSELSRRDLFKLSAAGVIGFSMSGWFEALAQQTANDRNRRKSCILLWMNGGPSQMDTFDCKPGHANGGNVREVQTSVPGVRISEFLPRVATNMQDMALIRSMRTGEGDHGRAQYFVRSGYVPQGPVQFPMLGSLISKELGTDESTLPNFVSIAPHRLLSPEAWAAGFLGPRYAPLVVGAQGAGGPNPNQSYEADLRVLDLAAPRDVSSEELGARIGLLEEMERDFVARHSSVSPQSHQTAYSRAVRLMRSEARSAFDLDAEPARIRDAYGRNLFGQGCLMARRLVERGVPFVEVSLSPVNGNVLGWDTHDNNHERVRGLCELLDPAWATLMEDLRSRGMLDSTLIVWLGEFGRTPRINPQGGRDHFPNAWSTVLCGGGIRGGQAYGRTSPDGTTVECDRPTSVPDFIATVCHTLGLDASRQNLSNTGRPIRMADVGARPIEAISG